MCLREAANKLENLSGADIEGANFADLQRDIQILRDK